MADINQRQPDVLRHIIARSCELKAQVVAADEREETGQRAVLNYGHTFCHAIEAVSGYGRFLHGEAVSVGMLCASRLAESMGRVTADDTRRQFDLLKRFELPLSAPGLDPDKLVSAMRRDKKVAHGRLRFVLPSCMGKVDLVGDVPTERVLAALNG